MKLTDWQKTWIGAAAHGYRVWKIRKGHDHTFGVFYRRKWSKFQ